LPEITPLIPTNIRDAASTRPPVSLTSLWWRASYEMELILIVTKMPRSGVLISACARDPVRLPPLTRGAIKRAPIFGGVLPVPGCVPTIIIGLLRTLSPRIDVVVDFMQDHDTRFCGGLIAGFSMVPSIATQQPWPGMRYVALPDQGLTTALPNGGRCGAPEHCAWDACRSR
jgi:hypothetical protein